LTPASYRPGLFLAIDNNQGKEKPMANSPLDQAADSADTNLDDLYQSAELLCREIRQYIATRVSGHSNSPETFIRHCRKLGVAVVMVC
jgi:hypothetical protein